ncbi:MAG: twin-arginine translocase TatA/TatE family subunit [Riemerella sp.]|nr:twin-arginine translocase TatA/TatE family subunit [Riemerella sp.]
MGDLSFGEIFVIFLALVILFGPKKIPQIARELGQGLRKMRGAVDDIKQEIMKETDEPISEIRDEIEKAKKEIENPDKPTQE